MKVIEKFRELGGLPPLDSGFLCHSREKTFTKWLTFTLTVILFLMQRRQSLKEFYILGV